METLQLILWNDVTRISSSFTFQGQGEVSVLSSYFRQYNVLSAFPKKYPTIPLSCTHSTPEQTVPWTLPWGSSSYTAWQRAKQVAQGNFASEWLLQNPPAARKLLLLLLLHPLWRKQGEWQKVWDLTVTLLHQHCYIKLPTLLLFSGRKHLVHQSLRHAQCRVQSHDDHTDGSCHQGLLSLIRRMLRAAHQPCDSHMDTVHWPICCNAHHFLDLLHFALGSGNNLGETRRAGEGLQNLCYLFQIVLTCTCSVGVCRPGSLVSSQSRLLHARLFAMETGKNTNSGTITEKLIPAVIISGERCNFLSSAAKYYVLIFYFYLFVNGKTKQTNKKLL